MKELTQENFYSAIKKCIDVDRYKVIIVLEKLSNQEVIRRDWLRPIEHLISDISKLYMMSNGLRLHFENGSWIRVIPLCPSSTCGRRADLVLCEPWMMMDDVVSIVLRSIETYPIDFKLLKESDEE